MNTFIAATLLLLPGISGFGIIDPSAIHNLHEIATTSLPQASSHLEHTLSTINIASNEGTNLLDLYKQSLLSNPLPTKMITGATLAVCGDAIAQSRSDDEYDKKRAASFAAFDCAYRAVQHFSFPAIVQQCQGQYIGALIASIPGLAGAVSGSGMEDPTYYYGAMEQTLASQLGIVPFFYYPVFYTVTAFVQGLDTEAAVQRAKDTFIPLMKRNLLFWIPVQFIQFGYIDENLQIPFLSVAGLAWTFIISLFAGNAKQAATPTNNENEELTVTMHYDSNGITQDDLDEVERSIIRAVRKDEVSNEAEKPELFTTRR